MCGSAECTVCTSCSYREHLAAECVWISPVAVPGRVVCLHSLARLGTGTEHSGKGNRIKKWAFQTHTHTTHTRTEAKKA